MKKILIGLIAIIIILGTIFFFIDLGKVKKLEEPIFCIKKQVYLDGGSTEYVGLGYKVCKYVQKNSENKIEIRDMKIGSIFMKFKKPNYIENVEEI